MCTLLHSVLLIGNHLTRIEDLVKDFVQWFLARKELVIELGVASGENPAEILHPRELMDRFRDKFAETKLRAQFHRLCHLEILVFVLLCQLVD